MTRSTIVVIWLGLVALSLRPVDFVERVSRLVFEPARLAAEIAAPLAWGGVRAAGSERDASREHVRALLLAEQESARPADPELVRGRGLVHAQVVDRSEEQADFVLLRFPPQAAIEPGMPLVCGEVYLGTIVEVGRAEPGATPRRARSLAPGEARARLVTSELARVGGRAEGVELVAGGLLRAERGRARPRLLALQALEHEPARAGLEVRVHEREQQDAGWGALAEGYRLGALVALECGPRSTWAIEPAIDYRGGFSQVFVLCPPERALAGALLAQDPFEPAAWQGVRVAPGGTPSFWRETRRLRAGSRAGLREGAAVADGAEFVGRIVRTDLFSSDVECLGDPGLRLLLLAEIPGRAAPLHLGRVRSLGSDASRERVYLAWEATSELARALGGGRHTAELFTGSGERGLPPGLHLGRAELVATPGAHVLELHRRAPATWGAELAVWTGNRAEESP